MISFMTDGSMPSVFLSSLPLRKTTAEGALEIPKYSYMLYQYKFMTRKAFSDLTLALACSLMSTL
jgi:hypothetical protein